ncbi:MAG: hypothetical protein U1E50_16045 [Caulobacteraceae bacterium]
MAKKPTSKEEPAMANAPVAAPAAAPPPAAGNGPELRYEDRPDLQETFVDNVQRMTFDGRTLRIEFCVTRLDEPTPAKPRAGRSIPICRLVLDLEGAVDLFNKLNNLQSALESRGVIRKG